MNRESQMARGIVGKYKVQSGIGHVVSSHVLLECFARIHFLQFSRFFKEQKEDRLSFKKDSRIPSW